MKITLFVKVALLVAILTALTMSPTQAASTKAFMFDPPTTWDTIPPTALNPAVDISHYTLKWGTVSGTYTTSINIGKVTSHVIHNVVPGTTIYAVVSATTATTAAHAGNIESANSNEAVYIVPRDSSKPSACGNARFAP